MKSLKNLKISYLTVHLSSGFSALKILKKESKTIKIVGVTTLTSLNNRDLNKSQMSIALKAERVIVSRGFNICSKIFFVYTDRRGN